MTNLNLWNYRYTTHFTPEEPHFLPACDVQEYDVNFLISMDVPGVKREDIQIEVKDETLLVSGERKNELPTEDKYSRTLERFQGKFHRAFKLGEWVDAKAIEASYEDGVLKICVPRKKEVEPETVKIKVGEKLSKINH
ncbi:MAG: Hsp20/alpha crystallin family protein [Proteobacteria bacterium]|nr:Hsp20/alpha crystallin family protein [Pseudomonadota bacterium]